MTDIYYRAAEVRAADMQDNGEIRLVCSTDAPVSMGGFREILVHAPGSVDAKACASLLLNHNPDQIIGGVRSFDVNGGNGSAVVVIAESAKTASGTSVRELVKTGALRGVSIGYTWDQADASYDEETRTATIAKWQLREITLTPTPADTRAHVVRSLPDVFCKTDTTKVCGSIQRAAPAAKQKEANMADEKKPQENTPDAAPVKVENEGSRALERAADVKRIVEVAESHGLRAAKYLELPYAKALESMLADKAVAEKTDVRAEKAPVVEVGADQSDKLNSESVEALASGRSWLDVARRHAGGSGFKAQDMNKADLAAYILGREVPGMSKRSGPANVTSSMFNTVVLANYMDKEVMNGFNGFASSVTYPIWTRRRSVQDFKTFASGALDSGNLVSTAENLSFPELTKAEGSFTGALGLYGATISLSYQAIVNDDLGEFMNMLNRAGAIAQRTIDKAVYTLLNGATWTNNTTSVTGLATAGDLDTVRAAFDTKTGPAGEVLGNHPKYLLVPSCLRTAALQATTQVQAAPAAVTNTDLVPVVTPHLTQAGTASQSVFYLAGDPRLVDTVVVAFLSGAETPQIIEYDAGAVAARKWKIIQAFVPVLASTTVSSTIYIPGMQRGD
jgi:HK97 family phage prohead protease